MSPAQQAAFETFWRAYPRKVGKLAAAREWARQQPKLEEVLAALAWQTQLAAWQERDRSGVLRWVPHGSTYLHQGRWMDEPPVPPESWRDECAREHHGTCQSPQWHQTLMAAPAEFTQRKVAEALERAAKVGA